MPIRFNLSIGADILVGDTSILVGLAAPVGVDHGSLGVKFKNRDEYITEKQPDGRIDYTRIRRLMGWAVTRSMPKAHD